MRRQKHTRTSASISTVILAVVVLVIFFAMQREKPAVPRTTPQGSSSSSTPRAPATNPATIGRIETMLRSNSPTERKDGIAAAVLIDTSGSMQETVKGADGQPLDKMEIARRCVNAVVRQTAGFAKDEPKIPTLLGIYEFSGRGQSMVRPVMPLAPPDSDRAGRALARLRAHGNTPIGEAIIQAKKDLDATRLARMHILIVTDGENTAGHQPGDVVWAISRLPDEERPGIYFIAFDVEAGIFQPAKDAGALVLPAANEAELRERLDYVMGSKILLE